ncbi:cation:proton antiporter [Candidatus Micrarchaeota archaeon]|nr:cation:proton antiporter [Candidatus Micrarchaeota archaeon]
MSDFFAQLGLIVLFSTIGAIVAAKFRQPPVIGLILAGMLIGPTGLGWIEQSEVIADFAELGAVLLLFAIGIEFSLGKLLNYGVRPIAIALIKMGFVYLVSYELALALGMNSITALYIGAIMCITSTALMIKILEYKRLTHKEEVGVLIGSLIVEDLFAVFLLTFFSALSLNADVSTISVVYSISQAALILGIVYILLSKAMKPVSEMISKYQTENEATLSIALGLGIGLSAIAQYLNLSPAIGAFLAGSLAATLQSKDELEKQIWPFVLTFSSIFFLSIGLLVELNSVIENLGVIIVFTIAIIILNFIANGASMYLAGYNSKSAVFAGLAMLSIGEFSLLIAKQAQGTSIDMVGFTSILVLATVLVSSLTISHYSIVHEIVQRLVPESFKNAGRNTARKMVLTINTIEHSLEIIRSGYEAVKSLGLLIVIVTAAIIIGYLFKDNHFKILDQTIPLDYLLLAIAALIGLYVLAQVIIRIIKTISTISQKMKSYPGVFKEITIFFIIIGLAIITPLLLAIFNITTGLSELGTITISLILLAFFIFSGKSDDRLFSGKRY